MDLTGIPPQSLTANTRTNVPENIPKEEIGQMEHAIEAVPDIVMAYRCGEFAGTIG